MSRNTLFIARFALFLGLSATGPLASGGAVAESSQTTTTSTSRTETFQNIQLEPRRVDLYETRLLGLLQGDPTLYYDQTFAALFGDPLVETGVTAAMMALSTANSGNPLSFLGPARESSAQSLLGSETATTNGETSTLTLQLEETIGPRTILIGDRGLCEGFENGLVYGCAGGTPFDVLATTVNLNINQNIAYLFTRTSQTTDTYRTSETWRLVGVPQTVSVPEPGTLPLLALGLGALFLGGIWRRSKPSMHSF